MADAGGAAVACALSLTGLAVAVATHRSWLARGRLVALAGLVLTAAAVVAMAVTPGTTDVPAVAVAGLGILAGGGAAVASRPRLVRVVAAVPGGWLLAVGAAPAGQPGGRVLMAATVAVAALLTSDLDRRCARPGLVPRLLAISAVGVFVTVPDTEHALILVGASLPLALWTWPVPGAALGQAGAWASAGILVWTVVVDGAGRTSSLVGAIGCLGLFAVLPLAGGLRRAPWPAGDGARPGAWPVVPITAAHLVLVYLSARVAGLQDSVTAALALVGAELAVAVTLAVSLARRPAGTTTDAGA